MNIYVIIVIRNMTKSETKKSFLAYEKLRSQVLKQTAQ